MPSGHTSDSIYRRAIRKGASAKGARPPLFALTQNSPRLGMPAGMVIDGIVGDTTGCAAGSRLGDSIDRNILHNRQCRDCGHAFSGRS